MSLHVPPGTFLLRADSRQEYTLNHIRDPCVIYRMFLDSGVLGSQFKGIWFIVGKGLLALHGWEADLLKTLGEVAGHGLGLADSAYYKAFSLYIYIHIYIYIF